MPAKVYLEGADTRGKYGRVQEALQLLAKTGSERKLGARVRKRLREIADTIGPEVLAAGIEEMPRAGGFAAQLTADGDIKAGLTSAGVALRLRAGAVQMQGLDRGLLRHPVHGNPEVWVTQQVPARAWTRPFEERAPEVREQAAEELDDMLRELAAAMEARAG